MRTFIIWAVVIPAVILVLFLAVCQFASRLIVYLTTSPKDCPRCGASMIIYRTNVFNGKIYYKCPECGQKEKYNHGIID